MRLVLIYLMGLSNMFNVVYVKTTNSGNFFFWKTTIIYLKVLYLIFFWKTTNSGNSGILNIKYASSNTKFLF